MRTVRCSGHRGGGGVCLRVSARCVCVYPSMLWAGGVCTSAYWDIPHVDRFLDTRLWKHYLSATTLRTVKLQVPSRFVFLFECIVSVQPVGFSKCKHFGYFTSYVREGFVHGTWNKNIKFSMILHFSVKFGEIHLMWWNFLCKRLHKLSLSIFSNSDEILCFNKTHGTKIDLVNC